MRKTLPQQILLVLFCLSAAGQSFLAGTARREITPREPVPMWGYGDRRDALSEGVLDPLYADALVLSDGKEKLAIVGLDLGRSPGEPSLERIRARLLQAGIRWSILGGSHTHHGPVLELTDAEGKGRGRFDAALRYYRQLEDSIVDAVLEAGSKLEPVRLASGALPLPGWNANRHTKLDPKPVDPLLAVLRIDRETGAPLAILVNWAAHPTTLPPSTLKFSADYAGALKEIIRKETGAAAIFLQGAAGDLRTERRGMDTFAYGEALGREAVRLARSLSPAAPQQPLEIRAREERFTFRPRIDLNNPLVAAAYEKAFFPELVRNYQDEYTGGVRPRLMAVLLGADTGMVAASGEFFSSHAVRLRERARLQTLFFFGYSNGYHQYFPTIEACAEGGYGADPPVAPAAAGAGEELMNRALLWLYQLRGRIRQ